MKSGSIIELLKQSLQFILAFAIFFYIWGDSEEAFKHTFDYLILLIVFILNILLGFFMLFIRPYELNISQNSVLGTDIDYTLLTKEGTMFATEMQRTVDLNIELIRRGSIWWRIATLFLNNKKITLSIEPTPRQITITPKEPFQNNEIDTSISNTGFLIDLTDFFNNFNQTPSTSFSIKISKKYPYVVNDHPDYNIPSQLTAHVLPILKINDKSVLWVKLFIKITKNEQTINYYKK